MKRTRKSLFRGNRTLRLLLGAILLAIVFRIYDKPDFSYKMFDNYMAVKAEQLELDQCWLDGDPRFAESEAAIRSLVQEGSPRIWLRTNEGRLVAYHHPDGDQSWVMECT